MSSQDNIASQQAFGEAVNSGNLDAFENLVAADSVDHEMLSQLGLVSP